MFIEVKNSIHKIEALCSIKNIPEIYDEYLFGL